MKPLLFGAALLVCAAAPALAEAPAWTVDKAKSEVAFSGTYTGMNFSGKFGNFAATIHFDPADLPGSSAKVTFSTASAATGDVSKDEALGQDEWLNPSKFPTATFNSTQITSAGGNNYVAKGDLTLKGKTLPISLPFTLTIAGNTATMKGTATVDRLAFGVGTDSDASGTFVSKDIKISVDLVATKAP